MQMHWNKTGGWILFCLVMLYLSACVNQHQMDLAEEKRAYFDYAFEAYQLSKPEKTAISHSPIPTADHGYQWTVQYQDKWGISREFSFNNITDFDEQILKYACDLAEESLKKNLLEKHFSNEEITKLDLRAVPAGQMLAYEKGELKAGLSDPEQGLKLKELTPAMLHNEWKVAFALSAQDSSVSAEEQIASLKPRVEAMLGDAIELLEDSSPVFTFGGQDSESSFVCSYQNNAFVWRTQGEVLDEGNTVDGRLTLVRKLYIGDRLIVDTNIKWNNGAYHMNFYYVQMILKDFGIPYEELDQGKGIFRWQIGEDVFVANKSDGSVQINDQPLFFQSFNSTGGIELKHVERMTGTMVRFDEKERAVVITQK